MSVQQTSANVSRLVGSPAVAAAIASSSRARPSSTRPDGDLGEAELGECPQFQIRVTRGLRDCEGLLGEAR